MKVVSLQNFTPTPSSNDNSYRMIQSHSELNESPLVMVGGFSEKQNHTRENPDKFNSELSTLMRTSLDSVFKFAVISWGTKETVKFLYHKKPNNIELLSYKKQLFDDKPITDLKNKIYDVYNERQDENWDGYGAEPLKFLSQSLKFADSLFFESRFLVESVDIIPENDGCLCFEWYKSDEKFISVSVKGEKLIYNYEISGVKGCGETNFFGKKDIIEKIKRVI